MKSKNGSREICLLRKYRYISLQMLLYIINHESNASTSRGDGDESNINNSQEKKSYFLSCKAIFSSTKQTTKKSNIQKWLSFKSEEVVLARVT